MSKRRDVLRYLARHLEWLAEEGAEAEHLDTETCRQLAKEVRANTENASDAAKFNFSIDKELSR